MSFCTVITTATVGVFGFFLFFYVLLFSEIIPKILVYEVETWFIPWIILFKAFYNENYYSPDPGF